MGCFSTTACKEHGDPVASSGPCRSTRAWLCMQQQQAAPHKDDVALGNMLMRVCGEEEVAPPRRLHHLVQAGLVDGQILSHKGFAQSGSGAQHGAMLS